MTRPINDPPWEFEANPYSIWVDTAGNQLPYIHKLSMAGAEDREVLMLNAVACEYDFQDRHLQVASLPVLLDNQERSGYTIHRTPGEESDFGVRINLAYDADPVIAGVDPYRRLQASPVDGHRPGRDQRGHLPGNEPAHLAGNSQHLHRELQP